MNTLEVIQKTREYLDYIEEHIHNVNKAWIELQEKCKDMQFVCDDFYFSSISDEVASHDLSKLSEAEFVQYRKVFYPVKGEPEGYDMSEAWEHHKSHNPHHWENWTTIKPRSDADWKVHCVHMIIDWMAMGYRFGDTAQDYYEKNKEKILIPSHAVDFIYEIFDRLKEDVKK